jgi:rfaE bifunctional protein nucleotidyltransferase chain/domain
MSREEAVLAEECCALSVDLPRHKILELDELLAVLRQRRASGATIVHCHGCFDVVHPGHIRYLEFARGLGDVLIVSLTGDLVVNKGANRPYIPQGLRAENLAALTVVDYVYVNPDPTAEKLLADLRPDLYVKGHEYETSRDPGFLAEKAVVESYGGRLVFSSGEVVFSSTELIGRMPKRSDAAAQRLQRICRDRGITRQTVNRLMDDLADKRVLVVGDLVLDRYVFCDAIGVAGEGPMMSLVQRDERRYVGGAAIVARHVAAMGAHAFLVS